VSRQRQPPHDLEAERSVIAGVLLDSDAFDLVVDIVAAVDFYAHRHQIIWQCIAAMRARGESVDPTTLRGALVDAGQLERAGGDEAVLALTDTIPTVAHIEDHARRVRDKARVRRMITETRRIASEGYETEDAQAYLEGAEAAVFDAASDRAIEGGPVAMREVIIDAYGRMDEARKHGAPIIGLRTGLSGLDNKTNGLHGGQLWVVGGRPGMGKSAFARGITDLIGSQGDPVVVFSLEMRRREWAQRQIAAHARINHGAIRTAQIGEHDWARVTASAGQISEWPIFIDETPALSVLQMRSRARRIKARHGLALIVVDYLQLARPAGECGNREQEIADVSRNLKGLAKELDVPVIALAQLNREVERQRDKRPTLAALRESGQVEQDADVILFLYRDELYNPGDPSNQGIAEVIIGKQRSGPIGTVRARFFAEYLRFDDLAEDDYPEPDPRDFQEPEQSEMQYPRGAVGA